MDYKSMYLKSLRFIYVILVITFGIIFIIASGGDDNGGASNGTPEETESEDQEFITTWDTALLVGGQTSASNQIKLPLYPGGTYDFKVEWGDGNTDHITSYDQVEVTHTYEEEGVYDVTITGTIEGFGFTWIDFFVFGEGLKLLDVKQWGNVKLHNNRGQFSCTKNLTGFSAIDLPDLSNITNMSFMFACSSFNQDIDSWDVSSITNMELMFAYSSFNHDIGAWDVSSVTDMSAMFDSSPFNQDIGSWDVSSVMDMVGMFRNSPFNQDIGAWDVSSVTDMRFMFNDATNFNQDLESWDVSNVMNMSEMFVGSGLEGNEPSWYIP